MCILLWPDGMFGGALIPAVLTFSDCFVATLLFSYSIVCVCSFMDCFICDTLLFLTLICVVRLT